MAAMHRTGESGVRVTHREMIGVIKSTTSWDVSTYHINPGLNSVFPWLSGIARNFAQYNINGLMFIYKPTCNDGIGAGLASEGSVAMSSDQNIFGEEPLDLTQMMQTGRAVNNKPSREVHLGVEQARKYGGRMMHHLLIRQGDIPAGATLQTYDDCLVHVATGGQSTAGVNMGELWLTYDVTLLSPRMLKPGSEVSTAHYRMTGCTSANPFGTAWTKMVDNIGVTLVSGTEILFDVGNAGIYEIQMLYATAAGNNEIGAFAYEADGSVDATRVASGGNLLFGGAQPAFKNPWSLVNVTNASVGTFFHIFDPTAAVGIGCSGFTLAAVSSADLIVTQVNAEFA